MSVKRTVTCRRSASKQLSSYGCELQRHPAQARRSRQSPVDRTSVTSAKWPETAVPRRPRFGRYRGLSGPKADIAETTLLTLAV